MHIIFTVNDNLQTIIKNQAQLELRMTRLEEKQDSSFLQLKLMIDKVFEMIKVISSVPANDDARFENGIDNEDENFDFPIDSTEKIILLDKQLQDIEYMNKMVNIK